jgi:NLI interacting factor-like phosphatase
VATDQAHPSDETDESDPSDGTGGTSPTGQARRAVAVVDIDGVVADVRHRLHHVESHPKDWDAFFTAAARDPVHDEGVALVNRLAQDYEVVFLTGRPEKLRSDTVRWLDSHGLGGRRVEMRHNRDQRPAKDVKLQRLRALAAEREVVVVVDDDPQVVQAMTRAGFPTLQATWETRSADDDRALRLAQEADGRT